LGADVTRQHGCL